MKKLSLVLAAVLISASAFADQYIVTFRGNTVPADFAAQVAAVGGTITFQHPILAIVDGLDATGAAKLGAGSGIASIDADAQFTLDEGAPAVAEEAFVAPDSANAPSTAFFFARQWHLRAIGADQAWAAGRLGSPSVTVAVLDTGIDRQASPHADLAGHVDYARGHQFQLDNPACIPAAPFTFSPTDDLVFHGTHVAATISSNALAAAGVTSKVTLVPVKVLGLTKDANGRCTAGSGSNANVLAGVLYAADINADVANMSLGGGFSKAGNGRLNGLINKVFNYAHAHGTLVVVSAGNSAADLDHDGNFNVTFCNAPNVVCVAATGPTNNSTNGPWVNIDAPAFYTNFGRSAISVAAPGGNGSFVWAACSRSAASVGLAVCRTGTFIVGAEGTSMASPHVSGLAALLVEQIGHNNPSAIKAALQQTADDLGQPGTDPFYGKGFINVPRALGLQ
ncbi:MAG TPA: S8 family serine peptidase [Thermoanaerobaculia bacterium]